MQNMLLIALVAAVLLAAFVVYAFRSMGREQAEAQRLTKHIEQHPDEIEVCELADGDPITLSVKFRGEPIRQLPAVGLSGVAAVQYFESLKALAPMARFVVTCNGRSA